MSDENKKFTLQPDKFKPTLDSQGNRVFEVDKANSDRYVMLESMSVGRIFYAPKANMYFAGESDGPINEDYFKEKFLPYLRWDFDEIEEVTKEVKVSEGKKTVTKQIPQKDEYGNVLTISKFPPTPENIAKKRQELIMEAAKEGKVLDQDTILYMTCPKALDDLPHIKATMKRPDADMARIQRIIRSSK